MLKPEERQRPGRGARGRRFAMNCYEWMEALITALILVMLLFSFVLRVVSVSGSSMVPTLRSGDRVMLFSEFYRPARGDVVVITHTERLREPIIKRVIALENQTVDIDFNAGRISVDGKVLDESKYIKNGITTQPSDFNFPLIVPKGHVFVLGDNREVSDDSRSLDVGMVDRKNIQGKAEFVLFPFDRFGSIS